MYAGTHPAARDRMMPSLTTALGVITGLVASLAVVFVGVLAGNGLNNPGISPVSASAAGGASASPLPATPGSSPFDGLDVNKDGKLSLAEAAGYGDIVVRFNRADRNKDGKLTKAEFDRLEKLPPPKARPKPKLQQQLRQDAAASLAAGRSEGR